MSYCKNLLTYFSSTGIKKLHYRRCKRGGGQGEEAGMAAGSALVRDKVSGRNTHTESLGTTAETFKSSNLK